MATVFDGDVTIQAGIHRTPGANVPASAVSWINISLTRENWPADGIAMRISVQYGQPQWEVVARQDIAAGNVNPKTGVIDPASIGFGWGPAQPRPTKVRIETLSPSQFATHGTVTVG